MNVIQQQAGEIAELTDGDSGVQQPTPTSVATIRLTANKYGLLDGSVHEVAGETESLQKQHSAFPPPRNPTWARKRNNPGEIEGRKVKHCCVSVGSYQLAVARTFMHSFPQ